MLRDVWFRYSHSHPFNNPDILLDQSLKPWLLEVNLSPALSIDSQTDIDLKQPLLRDMIGLTTLELDCKTEPPYVHEDSKGVVADAEKTRLKSNMPSRVKKDAVSAGIHPARYGGFEKIYPFDALTRANGNAKIGDGAIKKIHKSIKKKYFNTSGR
jgi:hypothetical protein